MQNATKWVAGALAALALAGCDDGSSTRARDLTAPNRAVGRAETGAIEANQVIYDQMEFLGNPLVAEVTILKRNHDAYNTTQPYNNAAFRSQTGRFIVEVAGRPESLAKTLGGVLYPDVLVVDSSKDPSTAGWLSWALANGWGGRKLTDDVVDIGLIAIFSSLLTPTGASCAPGQLPLCTDNVPANDKAFQNRFPYLAEQTR